MIKLVSRHQNTQQFGAILPIELTNEAIRNFAAYKEYYAIASGAEPSKTKSSVRKTQSNSDTIMPPPVAKGTRLQTSAKVVKPSKEKQPAKLSTAKDIDDQSDDESHDDQKDDDDQDDEDDDQTDSDNDGDDFVHPKFSTHDKEAKDEESFDPIVQTPSHVENSDNEGNDDTSHGMNVGGDEGPDAEDDNNELYGDLNINLEGNDDTSHGMNVGGDEGPDAEDDDNELYGDLNINLEGQDVQMTNVHTTQVLENTHVTLTPVNPNGQHQSSSVSS
nr:hypothetical protein [Tanacetum cinerariifolium]